MGVNAFSHDTAGTVNQQGEVSLLSLRCDGSVVVHPALVSQLAPVLHKLVSPVREAAETDSVSTSLEAVKSVDVASRFDPYAEQLKENLKLGRIWASQVRRIRRKLGLDTDEAFQIAADKSGVTVADYKMFVQLSNRLVLKRGEEIRRKLLWKWFLEGKTYKECAALYPFSIHYKTVSEIISKHKEILNLPNGGASNE